MYLPEFVPLPWRVLKGWERFWLNLPNWTAPRDTVVVRDGPAQVRLIALGDVALIHASGTHAIGPFDRVKDLLDSADVRLANLEAVITARDRPASSHAGMRAEPTAIDTLRAARFDVLNSANNHALDFGSEGLANCLDLLEACGIGVCGVERGDQTSQLLTRTIGPTRMGFLGFCDDINAGPAAALPRPSLWSPDALATIAAARREVDVLIVQLHWGYEFSLHPLRRHRDQARRAIEEGAHAVICHHAHVPQSYEIWKDGLIAYGLGNGCMPISPYLSDGHPWVNRSLALEVGFAKDGITFVRLHPLLLEKDGSPAPLVGGARNALLAQITQMATRLRDDAFLERCERARLVYETVRLVAAMRETTARSAEGAGKLAAQLALPRQRSLIEFLEKDPETVPHAHYLRGVAAASLTGSLPAALSIDEAAALANARKLYRWRDALRARLP